MVVLKYLLSYSITVTHTTTTNQHEVLKMRELTPKVMAILTKATHEYFTTCNSLELVKLYVQEYKNPADLVRAASWIMYDLCAAENPNSPCIFTHMVEMHYKEGGKLYDCEPEYGWLVNLDGPYEAYLVRYTYTTGTAPVYVEKTIKLN